MGVGKTGASGVTLDMDWEARDARRDAGRMRQEKWHETGTEKAGSGVRGIAEPGWILVPYLI